MKRKSTDSVVSEIRSERYRQMQEEGWTPAHDQQHDAGELAAAAGCYALHSAKASIHSLRRESPLSWPWEEKWWKPTDRRRDLVKAGALIVAEIERLDRDADLQQQNSKEG